VLKFLSNSPCVLTSEHLKYKKTKRIESDLKI